MHEDPKFLAAGSTDECGAMLIVMLFTDNQSYFPNQPSFIHFFFLHVKNFGTLLNLLGSNVIVHADKRLGTN